ncbi:hypothetical protein EZV77_14925 [Burkholderia thailandensis]|nr:hypothetical protein [Burkholderia thailandensis]MDD1486099.1 hypothetical protein [Burkholderia thailandensis]MDD1490735.1 hypothetical protein [Burkholderia thailandensis]TBW62204.1 hypothetical protein EZV77_14925 [Burkholderia thailandensis]TGB33340.1 hypothetical protein C6946_12790 [Burkholderia thailandensis]
MKSARPATTSADHANDDWIFISAPMRNGVLTSRPRGACCASRGGRCGSVRRHRAAGVAA